MIKGQDKLVNLFEKMTYDELPHTFMLLGEYGCGKHSLSKDIASMFSLNYVDITETINVDIIEESFNIKIPTMYVIHIDKLNDQNILLKFMEEFREFIYVCVICDNDNLVLNTILNRCIIYRFEQYSQEFLKDTIAYTLANDEDKELMLQICTTPGQLMDLNNQNLKSIEDICHKLVLHIQEANISNVLSLLNNFNFKDLYDKIDILIFFKVLKLTLFNFVKQDVSYYNKYELVLDYSKKINNSRFKKEELMYSFLIDYWKLSKGVQLCN